METIEDKLHNICFYVINNSALASYRKFIDYSMEEEVRSLTLDIGWFKSIQLTIIRGKVYCNLISFFSTTSFQIKDGLETVIAIKALFAQIEKAETKKTREHHDKKSFRVLSKFIEKIS